MTMPTDLCRCGHPLAVHVGSGVAGVPCKVCGVNRKGWPTGTCIGWDPPTQGKEVDAHDRVAPDDRGADVTGPAGATPTEAPAGPPDLTHAIQAATRALMHDDSWVVWADPNVLHDVTPSVAARIVLEAATPVLLQATRDRLADLEATVQRLREQNKTSSDAWTKRTADMESQLAKVKADYQRANEFIDANRRRGPNENENGDNWTGGDPDSRHCSWNDRLYVNMTLQQLQEAEDRLAELEGFVGAVRAAAKCNYDSFGMTQIDKALVALDQAAPREDP